MEYTLNAVDTHGVAYGFDGNQGSKAGSLGYEKERAGTLEAGKIKDVLCLNDQGGSVMNTSDGITATLRAQEQGHHPIILKKA